MRLTRQQWLRRQARSYRPRLEALEDRALPSTFTVLNTNDSGAGSFRQALLDANANANSGGPDVIDFAIATSGVQTISLQSPLPQVTDPVVIDGISEPGYAGTPLVQIDGSALGGSPIGLDLTAGNCTVKGLDLSGFQQGTGRDILLEQNGGDLVTGCFLGCDPTGTQALTGAEGIGVACDNNTIGGTAAAAGNVFFGQMTISSLSISGNNNLVEGNRIGTNNSGGTTLTVNGIWISGGSNNTIGGRTTAARNVISGNSGAEIEIDNGTGNVVQNNFIGTDATGTQVVASSAGADGVVVNGGSNNTIGGAGGTGNVIAGQTASTPQPTALGAGVRIESGTTGTVIEGNLIGTDGTGSTGLGNVTGVTIESGASATTVGGTAAGAGNLISANSSTGLVLLNSGNLVEGNFIGTDISGSSALGNGAGGVSLVSQNTVGGATAVARNVIAGNSGLDMSVSGLANLIEGNFIGTDATGATALLASQTVSGAGIILSAASGNTIGGTATGARNVIAGRPDTAQQAGVGIALTHGTTGTLIENNFIGTDVTGGKELGTGVGVSIDPTSTGNTIGGASSHAGNIISGAKDFGLQITGTGNLIEGNLVGTDATGTTAVPNLIGISENGPNSVGGTVAGAGNLVSGNVQAGITLGVQTGSGGALVQGNLIGTDRTGTQALPNGIGIEILSASNTIGGTTARSSNIISGNTGNGIESFGPNSDADGNAIEGNLIGTDNSGRNPLGNGGSGIFLGFGSNNSIGGTATGAPNVIAFNGSDGVQIASGTGNAVRANSIHHNGSGLGIDLVGGNRNQAAPHLSSATFNAATGLIAVTGSLRGLANAAYSVDFFLNPYDDAEGKQFVGFGKVTTNGAGQATFSFRIAARPSPGFRVTASATDPKGNTSPFSNGPGDYYSAQVFVVTNNSDSGPGSLREAILTADANVGHAGGPDLISFNIPGGGVQAINLLRALPQVRDVVIIDATSQPGYAGKPMVVLNGSGVILPPGVPSTDGLDLAGGNSTVRGLAIGGFSEAGILLEHKGGDLIEANFLGTDATCTTALGNGSGLEIASGSNNTIGGTSAAQMNVLSGNGVGLDVGSTGDLIEGNRIGTDFSGMRAVANSVGVLVLSGANGNTIGGLTTAAGNLISGNAQDGLVIDGSANRVEQNSIGTDRTRAAGLGNGGNGLSITGSKNVIGGTTTGNVIAFNGADGVRVSTGTGDGIHGNSIFSNTGLPIDLLSGGNHNRPAPQLISAVFNPAAASLTIKGQLKSVAGTTFTLEFFADPPGDAEGKIFLGSATVVTGPSGSVSFTIRFKAAPFPPGELITATAADPANDTSPFSTGVVVS